jgi:hypothetical protein
MSAWAAIPLTISCFWWWHNLGVDAGRREGRQECDE